MGCINCDTDGTAYTLRAHVEETESNVDLAFLFDRLSRRVGVVGQERFSDAVFGHA